MLLASVLAAAIVGGAVAAGVTLGIARLQTHNNPQTPVIGAVTVTEDSAAASVAQKAMPSVVSVLDSGAGAPRGAGLVISGDGYVVTSLAVAGVARGLSLTIGQAGKRHDARLVDYDCATGVAVLKVDGVSNLPALTLGDSTGVQVGQALLAVNATLSDHPGIARGVVSSLHRTANVTVPSGAQVQYANLMTSDLALEAAGGGAPLFSVGGQVIGIALFATGGPALGIPASDVSAEVQQVVQTGRLEVPTMGLQTVTVTAAEASLSGGTAGARVTAAVAGGPGHAAGLTAGDVVTAIDDQKLGDASPLAQVLAGHFKPDQKVTVSYARSGSSAQVQLTLGGTQPACP